MNILRVVTTIFLFFSANVYAAPVIDRISGDVKSGQIVTINGSGFGVKAVAGAHIFTDFEGGTAGNLLNEVGWAGDTSVYRYTNISHSGNNSGMCDLFGDFASRFGILYHYLEKSRDEVFFTFWIRVHIDYADTMGDRLSQWKSYQIGSIGYGDTTSGYSSIAWFKTVDNVSSLGGNVVADYLISGCGDGYCDIHHWDKYPLQDTWWRVEVYEKRNSTFGEADGIVESCHLLPEENRKMVIFDDQASTTHYEGSGDLTYVRFRNTITNTEGDARMKIWLDDIYVDTTRARVEIGEKAVFEDCVHREVQVSQKWLDGSISFNFNRGSFNVGDTAYVFVVDSNGNVSPGYNIIIGGALSAPAAPRSPSELVIK